MLLKTFLPPPLHQILCVEMHTTGEPTRIVYSGFPKLSGTLVEQRAEAKNKYDHLRRRLMLEPRGHFDMYGAILCRDTEFTESGEADMGVLFMHNEGFSTMCGHATIALGRFLVDHQNDGTIMPAARKFKYDAENKAALVRLHAPCGVVHIKVPVLQDGCVDQSRLVSFVSVPVFATGIDVKVKINSEFRWPELQDRTYVTVDFSYGGAFYCMMTPQELGFPAGLAKPDKSKMSFATAMLKAAVNARPELKKYVTHPDTPAMGFLYSIMLVGPDNVVPKINLNCGHEKAGVSDRNIKGGETGLCFFANQQIDRSPTGGCVAARVALAYAKGDRKIGERWRYQSLVSGAYEGTGSFVGSVVEELEEDGKAADEIYPRVLVEVEGIAYYTGHHVFVAEEDDIIGRDGFAMSDVGL